MSVQFGSFFLLIFLNRDHEYIGPYLRRHVLRDHFDLLETLKLKGCVSLILIVLIADVLQKP